MAVALVSNTEGNNSANTGTISGNETIGAASTLLLVSIAAGATSTSIATNFSATWNSVSMTLLKGPIAESDSLEAVYIFGLVNPATGTHNLTISYTAATGGSGGVYFGVASFSGTDTSSIANAVPSADTLTANADATGTVYPNSVFSVNTANGDAAYAVCGALSPNFSTMATGTLLNNDGSITGNFTHGYKLAVGASTTLQFGSGAAGPACAIAIHIQQPQAAANPFIPVDSGIPKGIRASRAYDAAFNPNLFTNPFPIFNGDQSFSKSIPRFLPYPQDGLNINLFKNPFPIFNGDQSFSRSIRWLPYPQDGLNINLFTNPYPFNQYDWSKPFRVPLTQPQPQIGINPNIFTNPYPFQNIDTPLVQAVRGRTWPDSPYNQNLYTVTVVANPFFAAEIFLVQRLKSTPLVEQTFNPNLFTNPFPFNQYDWSKPVNVPQARLEPNQALNINIFTNPLPFSQYDWSKPVRVPQAPFSPDQALNINLFTNPFPFNQTDWSKPVTAPRAPFFPHEALNINLFTNPVPIFNFDFTKPLALRWSATPDIPYNANLYTVTVVTAPFVQTDWAPARKLPTTTAPEQVFNPNLFTNPLPFNQFDYPLVHKVAQAPIDLSVPTNLRLFTNPIPFYNVDYTPQRKPLPVPLDTTQGFQLLYQPAPVLIPASYRLLVDHYLATGYTVAGTIVTEGAAVPVGWTPSIASEPLNATAIQAYWNAGPRPTAEQSLDFYPFVAQFMTVFRTSPTRIPAVYWTQVPGQPVTYILTGAGASLGPKEDG